TAPGTVIVFAPACGISRNPCLCSASIVSPFGAHPLAFSPYSLFAFASYTIANRSPPMPFIIGDTTPIIALVAIAASTALPPDSRIRTPACAASGDSAATIPFCEITIDRACDRSCAPARPAPTTLAPVTLVMNRSIALLDHESRPTRSLSLAGVHASLHFPNRQWPVHSSLRTRCTQPSGQLSPSEFVIRLPLAAGRLFKLPYICCPLPRETLPPNPV